MTIQQTATATMEQQIAALSAVKAISYRGNLRMALAKIIHSGANHVVKTAPAGKGTDATVIVTEQYICWEVNDQGEATSGNFGSPRAKNIVEAEYEEIAGSPGIWRKTTVSKGFLVVEDFSEELVNREGGVQKPVVGDIIGIDRDGYCHVIPQEKFNKNFTIL